MVSIGKRIFNCSKCSCFIESSDQYFFDIDNKILCYSCFIAFGVQNKELSKIVALLYSMGKSIEEIDKIINKKKE
jgi:hypothetical protein